MTRSVLMCSLNNCAVVNFASFGNCFQSIRPIEFDTAVAQRLQLFREKLSERESARDSSER